VGAGRGKMLMHVHKGVEKPILSYKQMG
jgi:hypothetical protein